MTPYFSTQERIDKLQTVAQSWEGTPFIDNGFIKSRGVSCQKLAGLIYVEVGFLPEGFEIPSGPMNWGRAHKENESLILRFLDQYPTFSVVTDGTIQPGDLVGFKIDGCVQHLGTMLTEKQFVHCWRGAGVNFRRIDDATFLTRLSRVWRPME